MGLEKILEEITQVSLDCINEYHHPINRHPLYKMGAVLTAKKIKEIIRRHMNDGWISVDERLPELEVSEKVKKGIHLDEGKRFLITDEDGYVYESTFWAVAKEFNDAAIAWREMPEPYRPEKG